MTSFFNLKYWLAERKKLREIKIIHRVAILILIVKPSVFKILQ